MYRALSLCCLFLFSVLGYVNYVSAPQNAATALGYVASTASVALFGSPLVSMAAVIRSKSTEGMVFSFALLGFITSVSWLLYGLLLNNMFIQVRRFHLYPCCTSSASY